MIELSHSLVIEVFLIEWKAYDWVVRMVKSFTSAPFRFFAAVACGMSFPEIPPTRSRQGDESYSALVLIGAFHKRKIGIVLPHLGAGLA